jgi:hypothetical protein
VGEFDPASVTIWTAAERMRRVGDPWASILDSK